MPGLSGIELARRARDVRPGLRVVYMSGYSHEIISHQGAIPEGSALVQKPFTRKELLRVLRETLAPRSA
jgi:CheY-like chemotaxis protein